VRETRTDILKTQRAISLPPGLKFPNRQLQFPVHAGWQLGQSREVVFGVQRLIGLPATLLNGEQDFEPLIRVLRFLLLEKRKHIISGFLPSNPSFRTPVDVESRLLQESQKLAFAARCTWRGVTKVSKAEILGWPALTRQGHLRLLWDSLR